MKITQALLLLAIGCLCGCAGTSDSISDAPAPNIQLLQAPPNTPFVVVGNVQAKGITENDGAYTAIQRAAASLGADAVIIDSTTNRNTTLPGYSDTFSNADSSNNINMPPRNVTVIYLQGRAIKYKN